MFNKKLLIVVGSLIILLFGLQNVYASSQCYEIEVDDIHISPSSPDVDDYLDIEVDFRTDTCTSEKVRLYLYIDNDQEKTHTGYYGCGSHSYEFGYDTDDLSAGKHYVKIVAKIYDNDYLEDSDSRTESFYLGEEEYVHDLTITRIEHKSSVVGLEKIPVKVSVKNKGSVKEYSIRVIVELEDETERSSYFSLSEGKTRTETLYIAAPSKTGTYEMEVRAYNNNDQQTTTSKIEVVGKSLTLYSSEKEAKVGEWVRVYGYATVDEMGTSESVKIYQDNIYVKSVVPEESGYYTIYVRFLSSGLHTIRARTGDLEKTVQVNIKQVEVETEIDVETGEEKVYVAENFSYVNIDVSNKELDVEQYGGNLLKITITNHLGKKEIFGVETDFPYDWVFLPHSEVLDTGESKIFAVYFNPPKAGKHTGNVSVMQGEGVVKTIPVSLFVPSIGVEEKFSFIGDIGWMGYLFLVALVAVIIIVLGLSTFEIKEKPLEIKPSSFLANKKEFQKKNAINRRRDRLYQVPWGRIIY